MNLQMCTSVPKQCASKMVNNSLITVDNKQYPGRRLRFSVRLPIVPLYWRPDSLPASPLPAVNQNRKRCLICNAAKDVDTIDKCIYRVSKRIRISVSVSVQFNSK